MSFYRINAGFLQFPYIQAYILPKDSAKTEMENERGNSAAAEKRIDSQG